VFRRIGTALGLWMEKATETDAIDMAVVERGIRDQKAKADKAHFANGQLAGQIAVLKEQVKRQQRRRDELEGLVAAAAAQNNETLGAEYAEQLADMEADLKDNQGQLDGLEGVYQQNTQIIGASLREIQKFERDFEATKARVAISRNMQGLAQMMKSSITELQGILGGEVGDSINRLKQTAAAGEGQMRATLDMAKEMGASIAVQQEARKARGKFLFDQYKQKMGMVKADAQAAPAAAAGAATTPPERQKIAEK
jgi:hypothetical protein